jgi:creatinine amidohydrolase
MTRKIWWGDFTAREFETLDAEKTIAVLPVAAIEQHGPHLPVSTDFAIMNGMLETVFAILPPATDVRFLPVQAVGKSNEHLYQPGTLTIDAPSLIAHWTALGRSVARAGVRKLVFINSHGGNEEIMGIVARELRVECAMMAVKTSWMRFGLPAGMYSETEQAFGIHGGDVETSLMLHFHPHLVDFARAMNFHSSVQDARASLSMLAPTGTHAFAWIARDLNREGVVGEAAEATAEKGRLTALHQASGFAKLLAEIESARLGDWIKD